MNLVMLNEAKAEFSPAQRTFQRAFDAHTQKYTSVLAERIGYALQEDHLLPNLIRRTDSAYLQLQAQHSRFEQLAKRSRMLSYFLRGNSLILAMHDIPQLKKIKHI